MNWLRIVSLSSLAALAFGLSPAPAWAWESDVHFGLTYWLAVQAGFTPEQARIIATGDLRVESGDIAFIAPAFDYACVGNDDAAFTRARASHYPATSNPTKPSPRAVQAGSSAASAGVEEVLTAARFGKAPVLMQKFGEALHPFQDSWSHQGAPDVPADGALPFACDPSRIWSHPKARGGWNSHRADLTAFWVTDALEMAKATYVQLVAYPEAGAKRTANSWESIAADVEKFSRASTKTDKANWFKANGVGDVSFLDGISLADGKQPFGVTWTGPKRPLAPAHQSRQPHVAADLLEFYHSFFAQWMKTSDFQALAKKFGSAKSDKRELSYRLLAWRLRDHGRIAEVLHTGSALAGKDQKMLRELARNTDALIPPQDGYAAYIPFLPIESGSEVSPLLPFAIRIIDSATGSRAVAIVKLRHIPYDLLAVNAEKVGNSWKIVTVSSMVDH